MGRASWRWAVAAVFAAVLALLPAAVAALPARSSDLTAARLRDLVRASARVGWSGTGESRAGLALPDVRELGDLPSLLGGTVRTRTWWRGPTTWRVDEQRAAGEVDVVASGIRTTTWTSADRTVAQVDGVLPVRLPRPADLVAPVLGRRLSGAPDTVLSRLPSRRVAGVSAAGLRLVPRDASTSTVASVDVWADPRTGLALEVQVRALVEGPAAYGHLSGRVNLALADAAGPGGPRRTRRARVGEVLEQVGLDGVDDRPVKAYSLGMRQRLGLAGALLRRPRLLVLDEPTNGLDPQGIREVRDLLLELNRQGTTVFLSSHLLAEIEALCTRVGVLDRGRLVAQDELAALRAPTGRTEVRTPDAAQARALLDGGVEHADGDRLLVRAADPAALNARLVAAGVRVAALQPERRTLEDTVLALTSDSSDRVVREPRA